MNGTKNVAERIVNAEESFIANVMERTGCSRTEALKVMNVYSKNKVLKLDAVGGTLRVKHGAFWDVDVLNQAMRK